AVVGPEHLRAIGQRDRLERGVAGMARRERKMPRHVPILGKGNVGKTRREGVHHRYDRLPIGHRQRAAGQEIVLHVDDKQQIMVGEHKWASAISRPKSRATYADEILRLFATVGASSARPWLVSHNFRNR